MRRIGMCSGAMIALACGDVRDADTATAAATESAGDGLDDDGPASLEGADTADDADASSGVDDAPATGDDASDSTTAGDTDDSSTSSGGEDPPPICPLPADLGCACDPFMPCLDALQCVNGACEVILFPRPPSNMFFEWQGVQRRFDMSTGGTCMGRLTTAMGDRATCYAATDDELRCAGTIFEETLGSSFVPLGPTDVDQVILFPQSGAGDDDGICVLADGEVRCMGGDNGSGRYGTGSTADVSDFAAWGELDDVAFIATGSGDELCALREGGEVWCAGAGFGSSPAEVASAASNFWITTSGDSIVDDPSVWRAQAGRSECQLRPNGIVCGDETFGDQGTIIDGGHVLPIPDVEGPLAGIDRWWLDENGVASFEAPFGMGGSFFGEKIVLAVAAAPWSDGACGVLHDGSMRCRGTNTAGKLGTGDEETVVFDVEVQPPGSVRIDCE